MKKKALVFDLDNTIYPVASIADRLFASLFQLLEESGEISNNLDAVKQDLMRKPFQEIAKKYSFSKTLTQQGNHLLENLVYNGPIEPFPDYLEIKSLPQAKYLVTSGYQQLQQSKIQLLHLEQDFNEIIVVDVAKTSKKEVFASLLTRYRYQPSEVLAIGDDPDSELKAAQDLGMDAVLYNRESLVQTHPIFPSIASYRELHALL